MKHKKVLKTVLVTVLIAAVAAAGAFYLGSRLTSARYEAEREQRILISRSDLRGLDAVEDTIFVTGHKNPDSDAVCSAIACAKLLSSLGYPAEAAVLGEINHETEYILEMAGVECPPLLESAAGKTVVLVDHSDHLQSADGLEDAAVVAVIDHHAVGSVTTADPILYDARPLGATATILWDRYRDWGVEPDAATAKLLLGALISDTSNLEPLATTEADRLAYEDLCRLAGITDTDTLYHDLCKALISYGDMTEEEIFLSDYKDYESNGWRYGIGIVNVWDEEEARAMAARMKDVLPAALESTGADLIFAQVTVYHDDLSITYLVPSDGMADEVAAAAFENAVYDGTSYVMIPGVSRRSTVVPAVSGVLESYPRE